MPISLYNLLCEIHPGLKGEPYSSGTQGISFQLQKGVPLDKIFGKLINKYDLGNVRMKVSKQIEDQYGECGVFINYGFRAYELKDGFAVEIIYGSPELIDLLFRVLIRPDLVREERVVSFWTISENGGTPSKNTSGRKSIDPKEIIFSKHGRSQFSAFVEHVATDIEEAWAEIN